MAYEKLFSPTITVTADVSYHGKDDPDWMLDIAIPEKRIRSPTPAVMLVHGGGWCAGHKACGMEVSLIRYLAHQGLVALSINYRLSQRAAHPAQIEDTRRALRWLRANSHVYAIDPDAIGAIGPSAGGHLVSLLGLAPEKAFTAADEIGSVAQFVGENGRLPGETIV